MIKFLDKLLSPKKETLINSEVIQKEFEAEENRIISSGITPQLLQQQFIEKWDGKTALYSDVPTLLKTVK